MNEKNQQVSDEQIDALIRSGLWQDEQPLTADEEKLADAAFAGNGENRPQGEAAEAPDCPAYA